MTFPTPQFPPEAIEAAKAHAIAQFPKESCGLIAAGTYIACENTAEHPEKDFRIDPEQIIDAGVHLQAVMHSHPQPLSPSPTAADMQGQIDTGCIWGIIPCNAQEAFAPVFWGDFLLEDDFDNHGLPRAKQSGGAAREPLTGRAFVHGASDCYTLIRAWYWKNKQIYLPEFPRDEEWWKENKDFYSEGFRKAGFRRISLGEARPGDVMLGHVRSKVPNHGGVLLEGSLLIHHLQGRLSCRAPVGRYMKYITHWLRYVG